MHASKKLVYVLVIFSMMIWGLSYIWVKKVYTCYTPATTVFLRILIATFFFIILSFALRKLQRIQRKDIKIFMLLGLCDPFGFFLFEGLGLQSTSPAIAAIIISTIPLFLPIAVYFTLNEKLSVFNISGLLVSFTGVLVVVFKNDLSIATSMIGLIFLFVAVGFSITSNIVLKRLSDFYNIYSIITWLNIFSALYFLPIFFTFEYRDFIHIRPSFNILLSLFALGIFASGIAFLFYIKGLKEIGVAKTNIFVNIIPVFTALFSFIFLGETLNLKIILGIFVVIVGLFISQWKEIRAFFV